MHVHQYEDVGGSGVCQQPSLNGLCQSCHKRIWKQTRALVDIQQLLLMHLSHIHATVQGLQRYFSTTSVALAKRLLRDGCWQSLLCLSIFSGRCVHCKQAQPCGLLRIVEYCIAAGTMQQLSALSSVTSLRQQISVVDGDSVAILHCIQQHVLSIQLQLNWGKVLAARVGGHQDGSEAIYPCDMRISKQHGQVLRVY